MYVYLVLPFLVHPELLVLLLVLLFEPLAEARYRQTRIHFSPFSR